MIKHRRRKRQGQQHKGPPRKAPFQKLESVNKNKEKIIQFLKKGQIDHAEQWLDYLRENQRDDPHRLVKSLSDLANNISDNEFRLRLYQEALDLNAKDVVTLTSYATTLADTNQPDRAFELFERSLAINPDETVTLTSYARALADANQPDRA
ncbi:MAG: hypothetical protein GY862_11880, partial [Gammaproteobacteria bacterium]|nr:hypothetical protein [Gammaproteobacteria bacterium]